MIVLAIDQGTSGTKALLLDGEQVLAVREEPVRPDYLDEGGVEVAPQQLLDSVLTAAQGAISAAGSPTIDVVSIANQGETVLAWDPATGDPLSAAIVWQDRRAHSIVSELEPHRDLVAERTGLVLDSYFSAPKMTWLRRNVTTEGVITTTDSWLVHQLTGEFVTDVTTASRSLVLDLDQRTWDPELLEVFGLSDEALPRIVANDEVVGTTTAFGGEIPVGGLVVDQQAALIGEHCLAAAEAKCTYGTGGFLLVNTGATAPRSVHGLTTSVAYDVGGAATYCLDAQAYTLGSAIRWLVSTGMLSGPEHLDGECGADSGGITFAPGLAGLAAPWWVSQPSGALMGLSLAADRGRIIRAVVEGLACQITGLVRAVEAETGTPLPRLRVDGGLTQSTVMMQTQADLLGIPIEVYPSAHATALGTAALGRVSINPELGLAGAVPPAPSSQVFEPQWGRSQATEVYQRWQQTMTKVLSSAGAS